jgi:Putative Se/S carrier protein-like
MSNLFLVFPSNAGTMIATRTLRDSGVAARMVPTPPNVQSGSNLCLSIDHLVEAAALAALKAAKISVTAVEA